MSNTQAPSRSLLAATIVAAASIAGSALASPIQVRDGDGGSVFGAGPGYQTLSISVDGATRNVRAGAFDLEYRVAPTDPWTRFLTYCLEPDELLGISGTTPVNGDLRASAGGTAEYAARAAAITGLWNTWYADSLTSSARSAAFQVALWEVAYDGGANLASGAFRFTQSGPAADAVRARTLDYLNPANWIAPVGAPPAVILRPGNQDLVVNVPEPAALALFGLGLVALAIAAGGRAGVTARA